MGNGGISAIFLSSDLVFSSRLASAGKRLGVEVSAISSVDAAIARIAAKPVRLVILDLATGNVELASAVARLREAGNDVKIVAYAPHVHEATLKAARAAGCDEVLTRGAFDARMDELLSRYATDRVSP
jgi:CheY-like chemotaxis protein